MQRNARPQTVLRTYPNWFYLPAAIVFGVFFVVPTVLAFYFSLTRWTLFKATFIGFSNYIDFIGDDQLMAGLVHTVIYAVLTSGLKVVISLPLAMLLTSRIRLTAHSIVTSRESTQDSVRTDSADVAIRRGR